MREAYLQSFKDQAAGRKAGALDSLRREGIEQFEKLGYPSIKAEDWKYTSVAALSKLTFDMSGQTATISLTGVATRLQRQASPNSSS